MKLDLTIIIPMYNKENTINKTLMSINRQEYCPKEVIVIDDFSTDGSVEVVEDFIRRHPNLNITLKKNTENLGVSKTRNIGINSSNSSYVSFLDADDEYTNKYSIELTKVLKNRPDIVGTNQYVFNNGKRYKKFSRKKNSFVFSYLSNRIKPNTNSWVISLQLIKNNNLKFSENISIGEDLLFFSEALLLTNNIVIIDLPLTIYNNQDKDSLSSNKIDNIEQSKKWIYQLSNLLNRRAPENLDLLWGYKYPATIIYNLFDIGDGINDLKTDQIDQYLSEFKKNFKLVNGIRSVKLYMIYLKIRKEYDKK